MILFSLGVFIGLAIGYLWGYSDSLKGIREDINKWDSILFDGEIYKRD